MVQREQYTISLSKEEAQRIKAVASASGETLSGYTRRQLLQICEEEESQK